MFSGLSRGLWRVPFGTQLLHRFEITNIYAAPVEITGLRVGCCCVTATPGKRILQPGESTTINVALDTRQFTGPNTQTVRVGVGPNPAVGLHAQSVGRQPDRCRLQAGAGRLRHGRTRSSVCAKHRRRVPRHLTGRSRK